MRGRVITITRTHGLKDRMRCCAALPGNTSISRRLALGNRAVVKEIMLRPFGCAMSAYVSQCVEVCLPDRHRHILKASPPMRRDAFAYALSTAHVSKASTQSQAQSAGSGTARGAPAMGS